MAQLTDHKERRPRAIEQSRAEQDCGAATLILTHSHAQSESCFAVASAWPVAGKSPAASRQSHEGTVACIASRAMLTKKKTNKQKLTKKKRGREAAGSMDEGCKENSTRRKEKEKIDILEKNY